MNRRRFTDIDALLASTPLSRVTDHYGLPPPNPQATEYRLDCVFNSDCRDSSYGQLTVSQTDPAKRIFCHSCRVRGNLLTLIHGLETGRPPTGGRLRADEFKVAVATLRSIAGETSGPDGGVVTESPTRIQQPVEKSENAGEPGPQNVPLKRHEKEAARKLENLYADLIVDPVDMSPHAAAYFRARPWLTDDVCRQWGMGYLPLDGRSLLRGYVVYTHRNERDDVLSYSGRDVLFDDKLRKWERNGSPAGKKPGKHRYVSGYRRGLELYGQSAVRLEEDRIRQSLNEVGLIVVEGANDVIRLDTLDAAAVGITSNRATVEQIARIVRFARSAAQQRVVLLPDCDEEGETGFADLLWKLNEAALEVRLGWSRTMFGGQFEGRQPEQLTEDDWQQVIRPTLVRSGTPA